MSTHAWSECPSLCVLVVSASMRDARSCQVGAGNDTHLLNVYRSGLRGHVPRAGWAGSGSWTSRCSFQTSAPSGNARKEAADQHTLSIGYRNGARAYVQGHSEELEEPLACLVTSPVERLELALGARLGLERRRHRLLGRSGLPAVQEGPAAQCILLPKV